MTVLTKREVDRTAAAPGTATRLEREAWVQLVADADRSAVAAVGLSAIELDGATAVRCRAGGPLFNRVYDAPADPYLLGSLRTHYEAAGVALYFIEIDAAASARAEAAVAAAGLERYRRGMIELVHGGEPIAPATCDLEIGPATADEIERACAIYCAAFDVDLAVAPVFASLFGTPRWHFFVARDAGAPVAVGVLHTSDRGAYLMGGATDPRFRGRGAQRALITARVACAAELGCTVVAARTGEATAGDRQHSQRNMMRNGFTLIGRCDSFAPPGVVWAHGRRA